MLSQYAPSVFVVMNLAPWPAGARDFCRVLQLRQDPAAGHRHRRRAGGPLQPAAHDASRAGGRCWYAAMLCRPYYMLGHSGACRGVHDISSQRHRVPGDEWNPTCTAVWHGDPLALSVKLDVLRRRLLPGWAAYTAPCISSGCNLFRRCGSDARRCAAVVGGVRAPARQRLLPHHAATDFGPGVRIESHRQLSQPKIAASCCTVIHETTTQS